MIHHQQDLAWGPLSAPLVLVLFTVTLNVNRTLYFTNVCHHQHSDLNGYKDYSYVTPRTQHVTNIGLVSYIILAMYIYVEPSVNPMHLIRYQVNTCTPFTA